MATSRTTGGAGGAGASGASGRSTAGASGATPANASGGADATVDTAGAGSSTSGTVPDGIAGTQKRATTDEEKAKGGEQARATTRATHVPEGHKGRDAVEDESPENPEADEWIRSQRAELNKRSNGPKEDGGKKPSK